MPSTPTACAKAAGILAWGNRQGSVLDPFPYIVQGKVEWLTTISVPVKENNKFLGVSGTDLRLTFLQKMAEDVDAKIYGGKGDVFIISYDGLVVANSGDASMVGKALSNGLQCRQGHAQRA